MADYVIWQDREIKFDTSKAQINCQKGECEISSSHYIEDFKGNQNESGIMVVTNLRMIWYQKSEPGINLSIGYDTILNIEFKSKFTQLSGSSPTIIIKAKQRQSRFEFIFKSLLGESPQIFSILLSTWKLYLQTKLYRDMKFRGSDIVRDKNLIALPKENIINKYPKVNNFGQEQTVTGTLIFTNIRIVWFANNNDQFNISIPWILLKQIKKMNTKIGPSLVFEVLQSAGGQKVGYQLENQEVALKEGVNLMKYYHQAPLVGIDESDIGNFEKVTQVQSQKPQQKMPEDDIDIVDYGYNEKSNCYSTYMTSEQQSLPDQAKAQIVFSPELGLAIEKPVNGQSIDDLWKIIKINK